MPPTTLAAGFVAPRRDAGTELRRRIGMSEPSYLTHPGQPLTMAEVEAAVEAAKASNQKEAA